MEHLNASNFADKISTGIVLVDFYAVRCGPCKMIAPRLEELATQYTGKVSFYKVDVDEEQDITMSQGITAMPTLKFFKDGQLYKTIVGADLQLIISTLQELAG